MKNIKEKLIGGLQIAVKGVGVIYQPTVLQILKLGEDNFNKLLLPYVVSTDLLTCDDDIKSMFKNYDLLFLMDEKGQFLFNINGEAYLNILLKSLQFFFRKPAILFPKDRQIVISEMGIIDRDNFDEVVDVILEICQKERIKPEKEPKFKNDKQRDVYKKLQEGRKRKASKETTNIPSIMNVVIHGGNSFIPYYEVCKMTYFQLINSYKSILGVDTYRDTFSQYLAGAKPSDLDLTHFTERLKI